MNNDALLFATENILHHPMRQVEYNDCSVVATANVLHIPYSDAHALLASFGRRPRRGTKTSVTLAALQSRATVKDISPVYNWRFHKLSLPTLAQFLPRLPKTGRFFITASHHAMAYVDGQFLDNLSHPKSRGRVYRCLQVTLPEPAPTPKSDLTQDDIRSMMARLDALEAQLKAL